MNHPRITLLMAVYNAQAFLQQSIGSVQAQTFADWQLVCIDDASTDDSLRMLQDFAARDERIEVLSVKENHGQAVTRNLGLGHAKGDFITMLDADDWLSADALQQAVDTLDAHPETDAVLFRLCQHDEANQSETFIFEPLPLDTVLTGLEAMRHSLARDIHGLYVVRAAIHLRYPYDDSYRLYSDDNTTHLHFLHCREVRFCRGVYYWRKHPESTTNRVTLNYFLYMRANQSMLAALRREPTVPQEVIDDYEAFRWRAFEWQYYDYRKYRKSFSADEQRFLENEFADVFSTLKGHGSFPLYCLCKRLRRHLGQVRRLF